MKVFETPWNIKGYSNKKCSTCSYFDVRTDQCWELAKKKRGVTIRKTTRIDSCGMYSEDEEVKEQVQQFIIQNKRW